MLYHSSFYDSALSAQGAIFMFCYNIGLLLLAQVIDLPAIINSPISMFLWNRLVIMIIQINSIIPTFSVHLNVHRKIQYEYG
jgi:hypothetical protein